jgi:hypothetical protein
VECCDDLRDVLWHYGDYYCVVDMGNLRRIIWMIPPTNLLCDMESLYSLTLQRRSHSFYFLSVPNQFRPHQVAYCGIGTRLLP